MSLPRITWVKARRSVVLACVLVILTLFVAANFVLVDVHLGPLSARVRVGWIAVIPAVVGFGAGLYYARLRRRD